MELKDTISQKIKDRVPGAKVCVVGAKNKARNVGLIIAGVVMAAALSYTTLNGVTTVGSDNAMNKVETPVPFPLYTSDPFTFPLYVSSNSTIKKLETRLQQHRLRAHAAYKSKMREFDGQVIESQNGIIHGALMKQMRNNISDILLRKIEKSTENYRAFHGYRNTNSNLSPGVQQTPFYIDEKELALQKILKEIQQKVAVISEYERLKKSKGETGSNSLDYYIAHRTNDYRFVHGYKLDADGNPQGISDKEIKAWFGGSQARKLRALSAFAIMDIAELFEKDSDVNKTTMFAKADDGLLYLQQALPEIYGTEESNKVLNKALSEWRAVNDLSVNEINELFKAQLDANESDTSRPG